MSIVKDIIKLARPYSAKGGSVNRRQQVSRMLQFATFAQVLGATSVGQIGKNHVIKYWKAHRELSDRTLYNHWLAISTLWELADKASQPPKPRLASPAVLPQASEELISDAN